ncbi:MAG: DUF4179 domain-containing protein [Chloroflexota bacterium]
MDERLIAQSLQEQARKDIPEDMNLIPQVYERLGRGARTAARSRLSWAAVAILGMLAVSVVAFAASRLLQNLPRDPGLEGASEADLVTELNMTQNIEDVAVTLDYAYADSNRISLGYHFSGTSPLGTTYEVTNETLTDSEGRVFEGIFGGGGGGGSGGSEAPQVNTYNSAQYITWDVPIGEELSDELNLRFVIEMNRITTTRPDDAGTPQPVENTLIIESVEPLVYEFTVPFNPGQVVAPQQSVTANDLTLTLRNLVITPSMTRGTLCFDPQEVGDRYFPLISLTIDGESVALEPEQNFEPDEEGNGCHVLRIVYSLFDRPGEWILSIDRLASYLPVSTASGSNGTMQDYTIMGDAEYLARVRARLEPGLQEFGIELTESDGSLMFSFPAADALDLRAINLLIADATRESMPGPWVFRFNVPPA